MVPVVAGEELEASPTGADFFCESAAVGKGTGLEAAAVLCVGEL